MPNNNKKVSFALTVKVKLLRHITEYSDKELHDSYYSREDYLGFRLDIRRILQDINKSKDIIRRHEEEEEEEEEVSVVDEVVLRHDEQSSKIRCYIRQKAQLAVFEAQWATHEEGEDRDDDQIISDAYAPFAKVSTFAARSRGLADEEIAKQLINDDDGMAIKEKDHHKKINSKDDGRNEHQVLGKRRSAKNKKSSRKEFNIAGLLRSQTLL